MAMTMMTRTTTRTRSARGIRRPSRDGGSQGMIRATLGLLGEARARYTVHVRSKEGRGGERERGARCVRQREGSGVVMMLMVSSMSLSLREAGRNEEDSATRATTTTRMPTSGSAPVAGWVAGWRCPGGYWTLEPGAGPESSRPCELSRSHRLSSLLPLLHASLRPADRLTHARWAPRIECG